MRFHIGHFHLTWVYQSQGTSTNISVTLFCYNFKLIKNARMVIFTVGPICFIIVDVSLLSVSAPHKSFERK